MQFLSLLLILPLLFSFRHCVAAQPSTPLVTENEEGRETPGVAPENITAAPRFELVLSRGLDPLYRTTFKVDPVDEVSILVIPIQNEDKRLPARYNITFNIPNPPEGCNPNETLWFSPAVYYDQLCMERDWSGKCTLPGPDGFTNQSQLAEHYESFKRVIFKYEIDIPDFSYRFVPPTEEEIRSYIKVRKTLQGAFCYNDRDYWMAFSTSCPEPIEIDVTVGIRKNTIAEKWTCRGFDHFMLAQTGNKAFFHSRLFWAIVLPIGYFIALFTLIFCFCTVFTCGAKGKVSSLLNINLSFDFGLDDDQDDSHLKR